MSSAVYVSRLLLVEEVLVVLTGVLGGGVWKESVMNVADDSEHAAHQCFLTVGMLAHVPLCNYE